MVWVESVWEAMICDEEGTTLFEEGGGVAMRVPMACLIAACVLLPGS